MKSLYDSALSGISKLMDSKIDSYTESKEIAIESLEAEKQAAEDAYQAQIDAIDDKIKALEKEKKANQDIIDDLNDEIDKIREANDERNRQLNLQEKKIQLERMQHQRTILQYSEDKGMHYVQDTEGIRKAKNELSDAEDEIKIAEIEKQIKVYEDLNDKIDDTIDNLNEQKDAIQDMIDASNKYYDTLIKEQEKYWDSMIKNMEKQKSKWEELAEIEEIAEAYSAIEQVFGDMGYTVQDVLNGNEQAFEDFKSKYISLLSDMNNNSSFAEGLSYATGVAEENLGSFLDKTKETADGISDLNAKASELNTVADGMDKLSGSATTASEGTSAIAENMGELNTNTEGLSDNLTDINNALSDMPEAENISNITTAFTELGKAIKSVADALGIGEDGAVSGLVNALQEISTLSLDGTGGKDGSGSSSGGIITQFNNLKTAVDEVTSAISGGSSENSGSGDASGSSSPSMGSGTDGEGTSGLVGAIGEIKPATDGALGGGGKEGESEGDEDGAIPQFQKLKTAVDNVTAAIGSEDSEVKAEENTLIGALRAQYETASKVLPETKALFEELLESIMACVGALNNMVSLLGSMPEIGGAGGIISVTPNAKGTVGNAFAKGTGKYSGLPKREKNALVSEYGQPEMTVLPNGKTILTDEPTMMDLPKDTVIFNEEQTKKIMSNKVNSKVVKSYANGNVEYADGTIVRTNGDVLRPLRPGDKGYDLMKAFEPLVAKIQKGEEVFSNAVFEHQKQMEQWTKEITNNTAINNIANNRNIQPSINIGDIHVTCPGVTEQQVAEHLGNAIGKELDKQFSGFHNYVDQQSRIR